MRLTLCIFLPSNKKIYFAAHVAAATLLDIIFRDIAIFFAALALAALSKKNN